MPNWIARIKHRLTPPPPRFAFDESGIAITFVATYWPPWNRKLRTISFRWGDIARITVRKWDSYIYDTIGMLFELKDGSAYIIDEDRMPEFYRTMERALPRMLPGIMNPDDWYTGVSAVSAFEDNPTIIYESISSSETG